MRKRPAAVLVALVAASALDAQTFQDSVRLDVVTVDVIATDRDGEIVRDLRREELILRIDGLPVPVDSFQPLRTQTVDLAVSAAGSPGPGSKDLSAPAAAPESEHLAILIDETSMSPLSRHDIYPAPTFHRLRRRGADPDPDRTVRWRLLRCMPLDLGHRPTPQFREGAHPAVGIPSRAESE